jgi:hypothetical protein
MLIINKVLFSIHHIIVCQFISGEMYKSSSGEMYKSSNVIQN